MRNSWESQRREVIAEVTKCSIAPTNFFICFEPS
jgi:hypothetical protein